MCCVLSEISVYTTLCVVNFEQSMSQKEKTSAEPMVMTSVEPEGMAAEAVQVSTMEARGNTLPEAARKDCFMCIYKHVCALPQQNFLIIIIMKIFREQVFKKLYVVYKEHDTREELSV